LNCYQYMMWCGDTNLIANTSVPFQHFQLQTSWRYYVVVVVSGLPLPVLCFLIHARFAFNIYFALFHTLVAHWDTLWHSLRHQRIIGRQEEALVWRSWGSSDYRWTPPRSGDADGGWFAEADADCGLVFVMHGGRRAQFINANCHWTTNRVIGGLSLPPQLRACRSLVYID